MKAKTTPVRHPPVKLGHVMGRPRKHAGLSPRERLDLAKAEKEERENLIATGKLHHSDACDRARSEESAEIRSTLLNLGNAIAPDLAGLSAREIKDRLDVWASETLTNWAAWANGPRAKGGK